MLPSIDKKIDKGIENSGDSTSNYSESFWIYFRDTLVTAKKSLPEQEESSIWLSGELDDRIKRIQHIIKNDHNKREVLGKF